ncbi:YebC/PmpR family DNA-binding transcriptional regulator [bacterium]|nr:YebC/PmpR family DNA-binding transcriptional regulator [bacterium]
MSGHSKWSKIKRDKAVKDSKRGAIFTKLGNLISIEARDKGGDPDSNFGLRLAIDRAKSSNMPKDNIEKAIKRGTGELKGDIIEELYYEGIGPCNIQFIVKSLTDNKNRSASDIKHVFTKYGGSFASVKWNFKQKGVINVIKEEVDKSNIFEEEKQLELIDVGAEDIIKEEEGVIIYTKVENLQKARDYLNAQDIKVESADIEYISKDTQELGKEDQEKMDKFIEELESIEDVSDYYTNTDL